MPGRRRNAIALLSLLAAPAACADGPRADRSPLHGAWRWIGSSGGIAGIRPTPDDEGYDLIFYFHRDGRLTVWEGDSARARLPYRPASVPPADHAAPRPGVRYGEALGVFPFDPGIDQQVIRLPDPDTLVLADPCCYRYEHEFVRVD